jgi:mycothiol synthase
VVIEGTPAAGADDRRDRPYTVDLPAPTTSQLTQDDLSELHGLVAEATAADGVAPLSEHALLHLHATAGTHGRHLVLREPPASGRLLAVAHVDVGSDGEPAAAEVVVRPDQRRRGLGSTLLTSLEELTEGGPLHVWAHGDLPAAQALAATRGYRPVRELWQMSRSLADPLPSAPVPAGFTLRPFRPGEDDDAWLAVNAAAFAHHPEQGAWVTTDLTQRMAEPWFDPAGFLLLEDDATGDLAGFHWTKVHPDASAATDTATGTAGEGGAVTDAVKGTPGTGEGTGTGTGTGEVYVVGVAPGYQGRGLAKPLTLAGLHHLRERGLSRVILYVDGDNTAAVRTYSGLGFTRAALDVQYARA